ncbi:MAG: endo-1,3(4)-beta-glucanase [Myxococcota bacterium]
MSTVLDDTAATDTAATDTAATDTAAADTAAASDLGVPTDAPSPPDIEEPTSDAEAPVPDTRDAAPDVSEPQPTPGFWTMGAPISTETPPFDVVTHPLSAPGAGVWPTNAWWQNLVVGTGQEPVHAWPYILRARPAGVDVCAPGIHTEPNVTFAQFLPDLRLGADGQAFSPKVTSFDPLSVTISLEADAVSTTWVQGMAYATVDYQNRIPRLDLGHSIVALDGAAPEGSVTGSAHRIQLGNGQVWLLFTSEPVTWNASSNTLIATQPLTGSVRVAIAPDQEAEALLTAHAAMTPRGGDVVAGLEEYAPSVTLAWDVASPLMLALPHHIKQGVSPTGDSKVPSVRGAMRYALGPWVLKPPTVDAPWFAPAGIAADKVAAVQAALDGDVNLAPVASDWYFGGKQIAAVARLALIAEELGDLAAAEHHLDRIDSWLSPWLMGNNQNRLVYDSTWGGVVVEDGLQNHTSHFGSGYYNDHHFHYGYHLYAAATLARARPEWELVHRDAIQTLVRDLANPSLADTHFTRWRPFDWFVGHSWAAGLFPFQDGRNQESTSEAINAWYAIALYGDAIGDANIASLGRLLLGVETASVHAYWQVDSADGVYPEPFAERKVVGILWAGKAAHETFFGNGLEHIHGIQLLPFTPVSEALLDPAWVSEAWPILSGVVDSPEVTQGWRGLLLMEQAVIQPAQAWEAAQNLTGFDDGGSRTNTLYWMATRPNP